MTSSSFSKRIRLGNDVSRVSPHPSPHRGIPRVVNERCTAMICVHFRPLRDPRQRPVSLTGTGVSGSHDQPSTKPSVASTPAPVLRALAGPPRGRHTPTTPPRKTHAAEPQKPGQGRGKHGCKSWKPGGFQRCTGGLAAAPVQLVKERRRVVLSHRSWKTERLAAQASTADPATCVMMSFMCVLYPQGRLGRCSRQQGVP
jgi:hypothetical protein